MERRKFVEGRTLGSGMIQRFLTFSPFSFFPQKARLARIRIAKASSGAAFVSKKKAAEARLAAQESGLQLDDNYKEEDIFELQHHHLLRCLEKTTVSWTFSTCTRIIAILYFITSYIIIILTFEYQQVWHIFRAERLR